MPPSARSACPSRVSSTPSSARFLSHSLLTSEPQVPLDTHVLESGPERRCPTRNGLPLLSAAAGPMVRADGRVRASDRPSAGHRARRDRDARHRTAETWPIGSRQALERRAQARGRPALGSRGESVELVSCELGLPIFKLDPWRRKAASAVDGALNQREAEAVSTVRAAAIQRIGERDVELALMAQAASPSTASPAAFGGSATPAACPAPASPPPKCRRWSALLPPPRWRALGRNRPSRLPVLAQHDRMLRRKLLYTGVDARQAAGGAGRAEACAGDGGREQAGTPRRWTWLRKWLAAR